jgi:hypothetical protein
VPPEIAAGCVIGLLIFGDCLIAIVIVP